MVWIPAIVALVGYGLHHGLPSKAALPSVPLGFFIWTLLEFFLHRDPPVHQITDAVLNMKDAADSEEEPLEFVEEPPVAGVRGLDAISSTEQTFNGDLVANQEKLEATMGELTIIASGAYGDLEKPISSQDQMLKQQRSLAEALSLEVARLQADNIGIADSVIEFLREVPKLKEPERADDISQEALAAMDESMSSLQELSKVARMHKEELASWQSELNAMHQRLADGSSDILKSQEVIVTKQSIAVESLDNLFAAHDVVLHGTKPLKTFVTYVLFASVLYVVTNSKRTRGARMVMYRVLLPGLCLETLVVFLQMTDPLINFEKFNVQLSWVRWIVTGLEVSSFGCKTHALSWSRNRSSAASKPRLRAA